MEPKMPAKKEEHTELIHDEFIQTMLDNFKQTLTLDERDYKTIIFITLLIMQCENAIQNTLVNVLRKGMSDEKGIFYDLGIEISEDIIMELTFNAKLSIYKKIVSKYKCYSDLKKGVAYFQALNQIRNQLFHCKKIQEIKYREQNIVKGVTKKRMISDLIQAVGG